MPEPADASLLIYAPVPLHRVGAQLLLEDQACNGLRLWAAHFAQVTAIMPVSDAPAPASWVPVERIGPALERIRLLPVPQAWTLGRFLRARPAVRRLIRDEIARADYLSFAIGGLVGDWGALACAEACRMGRPHAVWTDRVESEVTRMEAVGAPRLRRRLKAQLIWRPMAALERRAVRRATLGLFHGQATFDHYARFSRDPHLVHDIHVRAADLIPAKALAAKAARARAGGPLQLVYVGRADPMKGPLDWIEALELAAQAGVDLRASWIGGGEQIEALRARIAQGPLAGQVTAPGFLNDRAAVLEALRDADALLFCHRTPESPRVLIEALVSGAPLIGYEGPFQQSLIADNGAGALVPDGRPDLLAQELALLHRHRATLARMIAATAKAAHGHDDETAFAHRSRIILTHLPPPPDRAEDPHRPQ